MPTAEGGSEGTRWAQSLGIWATVLLVGTPAHASDANYGKELSRHIGKFKRFPPGAVTLQMSGTTLVTFEMSMSGDLVSKEIQQTSGDEDMDASALETIERAKPFPRPPESLVTKGLRFTIPIRFSIRGEDALPDPDLAAFIKGSCTSEIAGQQLGCRHASFVLAKTGKAQHRVALNHPEDVIREVWFEGENVQRPAGDVHSFPIARISVRSRDQATKVVHTESKLAKGTCSQAADYAANKFSQLSCSAMTDDGTLYAVVFKSDGSPLKIRRFGDEGRTNSN